MMNRYGIIMAGGGGTRFWPLSRQKVSKQLLNLTGKNLMVNEAVDRLSYIVKRENIYVVTNAAQFPPMQQALIGRVATDRKGCLRPYSVRTNGKKYRCMHWVCGNGNH